MSNFETLIRTGDAYCPAFGTAKMAAKFIEVHLSTVCAPFEPGRERDSSLTGGAPTR